MTQPDFDTSIEIKYSPEWVSGRIPASERPSVARGLDRMMKPRKADAERLCPVDTGDLVSTIRVETDVAASETRLIAGGIPGAGTGRLVVHALPIEFGHHTVSGTWVPAQPFIRPAMRGL